MKKLILLLQLFIFTQLTAQNLVLNPGLDAYVTCPAFGQFSSSYILNWDKPSIGSSDYYNWNCPGIHPTLQAPRNGEGYAGIICYNYGTEYREYITGTFSTPLVAGTVYDVEFYVSLHDNYIQAVEEIGAYISVNPPGPYSNALHIGVIPQIENISGAIIDTSGWKKIYGQYTAVGGEQYITIGNFHDDAGTTVTQPYTFGTYGAYYFVEDVSVKTDSSTSLVEFETTTDPKIFVAGNQQIQINFDDATGWEMPATVQCFNSLGELVDQVSISGNLLWKVNNMTNGIFLISLTDLKGRNKTSKVFVKN